MRTPKVRLLQEPELLWWFRLSLVLGVPVDRLKSEVSAKQLQHYKAVSEIDGPWWRGAAEAIHTADICYTLARCHTTKPGEWNDFLRQWGQTPPKHKLSSAEAVAFLKTLVPK